MKGKPGFKVCFQMQLVPLHQGGDRQGCQAGARQVGAETKADVIKGQ
jgi:hypothetical protein